MKRSPKRAAKELSRGERTRIDALLAEIERMRNILRAENTRSRAWS